MTKPVIFFSFGLQPSSPARAPVQLQKLRSPTGLGGEKGAGQSDWQVCLLSEPSFLLPPSFSSLSLLPPRPIQSLRASL
ncbi:hypothetical protein BLNAU_10762 [Blattamonas nauphoetae]|uniref:Uncharacterized protein n=1 Tax=Blattamonas nauphoetae TaxID=2049346 RepID=A0ABQ9XPE4_9EUKA|nr:hypothetical protein BLNAU_10762 [Blattamonas nauphoetae]